MSRLIVPPLAIYFHLPWCVRKCPYCDFNSHQIDGQVPETRYIAALLRDLEAQSPRIFSRTVQSIFLGGGTPSLFSPAAIGQLIDGIKSKRACASDLEVTMEANPGTIERGRFAEYRSAGINRVSLGGQSFNDRHLQTLGRIHSSHETRIAAEELHAAGLNNFNIDLMYALPGQSVAEAEADVRTALALKPAHLSHYQLTLEPGTVFFHRPPALPDDDSSWEMQICCQTLLAENGFAQYEISAYAPVERRCRHNLNYWQFGDYLGVGAGAHGKLTDVGSGTVYRTTRPKQPRHYMEELETAGEAGLQIRPVSPEELPFEFMLNALRLVDGFDRAQFEERTGLALAAIGSQLETAIGRGLLETLGPDRWRPTSLGMKFLNELQMLFLPPAPSRRLQKTATSLKETTQSV